MDVDDAPLDEINDITSATSIVKWGNIELKKRQRIIEKLNIKKDLMRNGQAIDTKHTELPVELTSKRALLTEEDIDYEIEYQQTLIDEKRTRIDNVHSRRLYLLSQQAGNVPNLPEHDRPVNLQLYSVIGSIGLILLLLCIFFYLKRKVNQTKAIQDEENSYPVQINALQSTKTLLSKKMKIVSIKSNINSIDETIKPQSIVSSLYKDWL